ncbi:aldo/keto reductase [Methanosphaera sp. WGK6]|uniref:aldo/keto reductase n=1 Tax=Methanosphaera sp. WGK6 TaxID=1561964 RepID=UPI0013017612|nr:aldo/keto reductase [Methanosphaera sp. WGK6]
MLGKTGISASILGFGAMRLPLLDENPEHVDIKQTEAMIEYAVNNGINMFDTAWVYHTTDRSKPGVSETILGDILSSGFHDKIHISTKMPSWEIKSWEYFDSTLDKQLERLKTDQIDLFFIHSIKDSFYADIKEKGLYEFVDKALSDGRIKHICFSTHGSYELLNQILDDYDKWECVLTQLNYLDEMDNPGLNGLKKLNKLGLGTMIMEPLRGGKLAQNQPVQVQKIFENSTKKYKPIEWAFNYLWDKSEVNCVLSGMNNLEQVKENIALVENANIGMLDDEDKQVLYDVKKEYDNLINIPCTECNYCMPCPFGVNIPKCFREYNMDVIGDQSLNSVQYKFHMHEDRQAHNCVNCKKCIESCPQNIDIPKQLEIVKKHFGA